MPSNAPTGHQIQKTEVLIDCVSHCFLFIYCHNFTGGEAQGVSQPDEQKDKEENHVKDATDAIKSLSLGAGDTQGDIIERSQDMLIAVATQPGE